MRFKILINLDCIAVALIVSHEHRARRAWRDCGPYGPSSV
jgi:hypothetical protein